MILRFQILGMKIAIIYNDEMRWVVGKLGNKARGFSSDFGEGGIIREGGVWRVSQSRQLY